MKKRRLLWLLLWFFFTSIMLASTTFAWFTANRIVTITTLNVHVATQGGIEISTDAINWRSVINIEDLTDVKATTYPDSTNQIPIELEPVSTAKEIDSATGFLRMYHGITNNDVLGNYILTSTRSIEDSSSGVSSDGNFITFDLFFRVSEDTDMYLTTSSGASYSGPDNTGIMNAARIAFLDQGTLATGSPIASIQALHGATEATTYIWEPNYDVHTPAAIVNAFDTYGIVTTETGATAIPYDGVRDEISAGDNVLLGDANASLYPSLFRPINIDYYTRETPTNNQQIFTLRRGITKIRLYLWIEGQDVDCENHASYGDIVFNLQFTVNPS